MTKYSKRASSRNHHLDLFGWHRERELRHGNPAARRIAKQFQPPSSPRRHDCETCRRSDSRRQAIADRELADA